MTVAVAVEGELARDGSARRLELVPQVAYRRTQLAQALPLPRRGGGRAARRVVRAVARKLRARARARAGVGARARTRCALVEARKVLFDLAERLLEEVAPREQPRVQRGLVAAPRLLDGEGRQHLLARAEQRIVQLVQLGRRLVAQPPLLHTAVGLLSDGTERRRRGRRAARLSFWRRGGELRRRAHRRGGHGRGAARR